VIERAHAIAGVCELHGVTLAQAALAFAVRPAAVRSVVVGAETPDQVAEAARQVARPVPEALWSDLAAAKLTTGAPAAP
jgi:D-threo-aldose 1-dehydrogenase